jgi:hypothetical protein
MKPIMYILAVLGLSGLVFWLYQKYVAKNKAAPTVPANTSNKATDTTAILPTLSTVTIAPTYIVGSMGIIKKAVGSLPLLIQAPAYPAENLNSLPAGWNVSNNIYADGNGYNVIDVYVALPPIISFLVNYPISGIFILPKGTSKWAGKMGAMPNTLSNSNFVLHVNGLVFSFTDKSGKVVCSGNWSVIGNDPSVPGMKKYQLNITSGSIPIFIDKQLPKTVTQTQHADWVLAQKKAAQQITHTKTGAVKAGGSTLVNQYNYKG